MNTNKNEVFNFDNVQLTDQILRTYIECTVKYNTLDWFLYYEDYFIEHTNTSLLDLSTPMQSISINENSTPKEVAHYFRYLKACHLGVEYIEHSLKLLLMLEGHDIKEIKRLGLEHNLEKHFEMLKDENVKALIIGSIGIYGDKYIESVLSGIPTNMEFNDWSDKEKTDFDLDLELIGKKYRGEMFTTEERERYENLERLISAYEEHKYDNSSRVSNKYFNSILKILSNSFVDLRYPEVSKTNNYYNLDIILSICANVRTALTQKIETSRILESEKLNIEEYVSKLLSDDEVPLNYSIDNDIVVLDRPLTKEEKTKMKAANVAKFEALMWYMYGMEEFYLSGKRDYWATLGDVLYTTSITRERISSKSNDKAVYENYLYYQACHMASDFIEHSLKLLLLNNGYTYKDIKEQFGHDFKKMYYALTETEKKDIRGIVFYFNENYLQNASAQNSNFRDVIKYSVEEKEETKKIKKFVDLTLKRDFGETLTPEEEEYINNYLEENLSEENLIKRNEVYQNHKQELSDKYFDKILTQVSDAFKFTRYPDFYNYNMDYKYCLKFLLAFAQELQGNIERNQNVRYYIESKFDLNNQDNNGNNNSNNK